MRRWLIMTCLAAALPALAQQASGDQNRMINEIAQCLQAGLPQDWAAAEVQVELKEPGATTGDVTYVMRRALAGGEFQIFRPCDPQLPARLLLDVREQQSATQRNWNRARLVIRNDGTYDLTFDYPQK